MEVVVDSKNRILLPKDIREKLRIKPGTVLKIIEIEGGFKVVVTGKRRVDEVERINQVLLAKPRRTGEPENWDPRRMKSIWVG